MFCRFCGAENEEHAVFCKKCGKSLGAEPPVEQPTAVIPAKPAADPTPPEPVPAGQVPAEPPVPIAWEGPLSCPHCHAGGDHCHPVVKTDVKTSGGGYGFWSGCCSISIDGDTTMSFARESYGFQSVSRPSAVPIKEKSAC